MLCARCATLVLALLLAPGQGALAHGAGTGEQAAESSETQVALTVRLDPEAAVPPVVRVPPGAHVHLTVVGAEAGELHLHGYDVEAAGGGAAPAVLVFEATHEGRFPVEAHVEDDLMGRRSRAVLFVEVRAP